MTTPSPDRFVLPDALRAEIDAIDPLQAIRTDPAAEAIIADARLTHGSLERYPAVLTEVLGDLEAATTAYCNDIESVLATPEDGLDPMTRPRSSGDIVSHEVSGEDFRQWLGVVKKHAPATANEALGEVIHCVIDHYDSEAFRRASWGRGSPAPDAARNLRQDADSITEAVVTSIVDYSSDAGLARLFMGTDLFADYGDTPRRLRLLQHIVSLTGPENEQGITPEYKEVKRLATRYIGRLLLHYGSPPVDYRLLVQHSPGMLQTIAERHAPRRSDRAELIGVLGANALLQTPRAARTPEQTAELAALEGHILHPIPYAAQLEARLQKDGSLAPGDLVTLERRIKKIAEVSDAEKLVRLAVALLPVERVENLIRSNLTLLIVPQAGAIAVRRLARHGNTSAAHWLASALDAIHPGAPASLYNLIAVYEESGDPEALQQAEHRWATEYIGHVALDYSLPQEYLIRSYLAARRQRAGTRITETAARLRSYCEQPMAELRYRALRQRMQVHLMLNEPDAAETYATRIYTDQELTRQQQLEAMQSLTIEHARTGNLSDVRRLLLRHLPTDSTRMSTLIDWTNRIITKDYPTVPRYTFDMWEAELDPTRRYRAYDAT